MEGVNTNRLALLEALGTMPEEAFGWFVLACRANAMMHGARSQIWPDGIGGFTQASRDSIEAVRTAAQRYIDRTITGLKR